MDARNSLLIYYWLLFMVFDYTCAFMVPIRVPGEPYQDDLREDDRSVFQDCERKEVQMFCTALCGEVHACVLGKCFCVNPYLDPEPGRDSYNYNYYDKHSIKRDPYGDLYADNAATNHPEVFNLKSNSKRDPFPHVPDMNAGYPEVTYSKKKHMRDPYGDMYVDSEILHAPQDYYQKKSIKRDLFDDNRAMDRPENSPKQEIWQDLGDLNDDKEALGGHKIYLREKDEWSKIDDFDDYSETFSENINLNDYN